MSKVVVLPLLSVAIAKYMDKFPKKIYGQIKAGSSLAGWLTSWVGNEFWHPRWPKLIIDSDVSYVI